MVRISKSWKWKTLYIDLSVFPCWKWDTKKNLTISCSNEKTKFKTSLSDNWLKKFKEYILQFYNEYLSKN